MIAPLRRWEQELLTWVLPAERPAYRAYRELVRVWAVASRGERGEGSLILTPDGTGADVESSLPQVFAYGVVQTTQGDVAVTVRERLGEQLNCDISILSGRPLPELAGERRRWSYSTWKAGMPCPMCGGEVREVYLRGETRDAAVLAACISDERLWVYDSAREVTLPIPLTGYYAELMRVQGVRDPEIALDPRRLYSALGSYTDEAMAEAFLQYNKMRPKIAAPILPSTRRAHLSPLRRWIRSILGTSSS